MILSEAQAVVPTIEPLTRKAQKLKSIRERMGN